LALAAGALLGTLVLGFGVFSTAHAQLTGSLFSDDFTTSEYYTNKAQVKMRLSGKRAQPSGPGRYLIKQLRLETFYEDGQPQITIEAPECVYDFSGRTASSPGPLKILLGDDRARITGEGFLWQQAQSSLIISNQVHTRLRDVPNSISKP